MKLVEFTRIQKQRLEELGGGKLVDLRFQNETEREQRFDQVAQGLEKRNKEGLLKLLKTTKTPTIKQLEREIALALTDAGFTEVSTPSIIPKEFINRMGITESHNLWRQIFWLDAKRCLRPMLAPNLYHVMEKLRRFLKPVSIFEVGSCFRKESKGRMHAEEFAMLNAVELAPEKQALERLREIIATSLKAVGMPNYELQKVESDVYDETIDVIVDGVEVGSAATGPHRLDRNWKIIEPWAGVGFGMERLAMIRIQSKNLGHVGRSLRHLDGFSLNLM